VKLRFVIVALASLFVLPAAGANPPGSDEEIRNRLTPAGSVCRAGDNCAAAATAGGGGSQGTMSGQAMSGQQVYDQFCFVCHATGVAGAPKLGVGEDWQPRLAKGLDTLWATTTNGLGAMPAKGTCANCSDDELRGAMDYMLESVQ